MAGLRLDSTGQIKMKTLDEALVVIQRINGLVENYAMAIKRNTPGGPFLTNIRRQLPSLGENLKGQFGLITDLILSVNLSSSRGASDVMRVRALREGVAQIKQALEIAITQTKTKHAIEEESKREDAERA